MILNKHSYILTLSHLSHLPFFIFFLMSILKIKPPLNKAKILIGSGGSMVILIYLVGCIISFNAGSGKVL